MFKIRARNQAGQWDLGMVGEPNDFETMQEASDAIDALQAGEYGDTVMQVVRLQADGTVKEVL